MDTDDTLNYERLLLAIKSNKICIIDFMRNETQEVLPIICAIANSQDKGEPQQVVPLAILLQNKMGFWDSFSPVMKKNSRKKS